MSDDQPLVRCQPKVVGLFGLPGSGKTTILKGLEQMLKRGHFTFYEGSEVIEKIVEGGLSKFQAMDKEQKAELREKTIEHIKEECIKTRTTGVVTGHFMFWKEGEDKPDNVMTEADLATYTHIIYLDTPADVLYSQQQGDFSRERDFADKEHLTEWTAKEIKDLRDICLERKILFTTVLNDGTNKASLQEQVAQLMRIFRTHDDKYNVIRAEDEIDRVVTANPHLDIAQTMIVLDGDKSLAAEDSGSIFWNHKDLDKQRLNGVFKNMGYTYEAFQQAALLYDEMGDVQFESRCLETAGQIHIRPEFISLLNSANNETGVSVVVLTSGLQCIWEEVMKSAGLSEKVSVIGGSRIGHGLIVTPDVKGAIIQRLRDKHHMFVWAFGDSPIDIEMLRSANRAIVVVGDERTRSKSMEQALEREIEKGMQVRQLILPNDSPPRLDLQRLPQIHLDQPTIDDMIKFPSGLKVVVAPETNAVKLLQTNMRDNNVPNGPVLREAHRRVGWYLATALLSEEIGVEEKTIRHVQGREDIGHQLLNEAKTTIVPLMRGGEPMAFGVNEAFPMAQFVHAKEPEDLKTEHLKDQATVILVDSVVNAGTSIAKFTGHIRGLNESIRIVVVTGVLQADAVNKGGLIARALRQGSKQDSLTLIALRKSANKYTGSGGTDTGNRLFNTTHLK